MTTELRPELEPLPSRLLKLPVDPRGYPVPWFVEWENGKPEFRAMDPDKWKRAVRDRLCWVCGDPLGVWLTFVIGPMCGINRTTAEPACHHECAVWSARNCPFMSRPQMVRREDEVLNSDLLAQQSGGSAIDRNPGVALLWTTKRFTVFRDPAVGKPLITVGDPWRVEWFAHGRPATRAEVEASVNSGLPLLEQFIEKESTVSRQLLAAAELRRAHRALIALYPAA